MDYNDFAARLAAAPSQFGRVGSATTVGMRIRYKGSSASCTIEVAPTGILSKIGASGAEVADSNFQTANAVTSGVITYSGTDTLVDTFGELVDFVNNLTDYEAVLVGVKRDDGTTGALATHAAAATGVQTPEGVVLYLSNTVEKTVGFAIKPDYNCARNTSADGKPAGYKSYISRIHVDRNDATEFTGTCSLQIYSSNTLIWENQLAATGAISHTLSLDNIKDGTIESGVGEPLLVRVSTPTGTSCLVNLEVIGKSVKVKDS